MPRRKAYKHKAHKCNKQQYKLSRKLKMMPFHLLPLALPLPVIRNSKLSSLKSLHTILNNNQSFSNNCKPRLTGSSRIAKRKCRRLFTLMATEGK